MRHTEEVSTTKDAYRFPKFVFPHRSHVEQSATERQGSLIPASNLPKGATSSRPTGSSPMEVDVSFDVAAATPSRPSIVSQAASKAAVPSPTDSISPIAESLPGIGINREDPSLTSTAFIRTSLMSGTHTAILPDLGVSSHGISTSSIINSAITQSTAIVSLPSSLTLKWTPQIAEGQYRPSDGVRPQTSERRGAKLTPNGIIQVCKPSSNVHSCLT